VQSAECRVKKHAIRRFLQVAARSGTGYVVYDSGANASFLTLN